MNIPIYLYEPSTSPAAQSNPRRLPAGARKIYQSVIKIYATKAGMDHQCDDACAGCGHKYVHKFKTKNSCIYGLPDGSLLIVSE